MSKTNWLPLIVVIAVLIVLGFIGGRFLYFGSGATTYTPPERELQSVSVESAAIPPRLETVDNPTESAGVVVIDYSHDNALFIEELNVLLSKIVSRGYSYEVAAADPEAEDSLSLIDRLSYAKSLILPLPRAEYTAEEIVAIEEFVEKGGQVLIISDPTRTIFVEALNSIAGSFGVIYANDYLYSLESNDNNYRNVVYTEFMDSPITNNIDDGDKIIFYASNSVSAPGHEVITGDETVFSSTSDSVGSKAAAALTTQDQVLAIGDLTFLTEPYNASESNGVLINNIADFLTTGVRTFEIRDFPYFFDTQVDVVFDDTLVFNSQFEDSVKLKEFLENTERTVNFTNEISGDHDAIFIGRFDRADNVQKYLDEANIVLLEPENEENGETDILSADAGQDSLARVTNDSPEEETDERFVEGRIQIEGVGDLEQGGATLFYLHQEDDQNILIVLSKNAETNADAFELLLENKFNECVVNPAIAVCQTKDPDEKLPPSLRSNRIDKILVVSDDDGRARETEQTSLLEYTNVLSASYNVSEWVTSEDGSPDLQELQEYDAIIWTTGDYWDDSIGAEDVETLNEYVVAGGNLLLSGASIAFDWDHTDFVTDIVHADYLTTGEQTDLEVASPEHPIASDFAEGAVITLTESAEGLEIDVVNHTPDSRVIFRRGPDSDQAGAASVIAYEDDRSKIAYFAFPLYLLEPASRTLLVDNTVDWFTRTPLDLPDETDYEPFELDGSGSVDEGDETSEEGEGEEEDTATGDEGEEENGGEEEEGEGEEGDGGA